MSLTVAIIGTGPTGIYSFQALAQLPDPMSIWLFEKGDTLGIGMPYSPETSTKSMLANIASIEIPALTSTYLDWMQDQPAATLRGYGLDPDNLDDRLFTPRLLLGEFFRDQMVALIALARANGHEVHVREATEVTDILVKDKAVHLTVGDARLDVSFDHVIVATGHVFPEESEAGQSYFPSPWSGLIDAQIPATTVGIMGTSLSSIDAAMAVATQHGTFTRSAEDGLRYNPSSDGLMITLMSWTGVLPEADFYCPLPYEPLSLMTDEALENLPRGPGLLDRLFDLFRAEIASADPDYAQKIGLDDLTADSFPDAYFAEREAHDPFRWARSNLEEVERNKADKITVPWRYAILKMHEAFEAMVADLTEDDRARFDDGLKKVFVDNYAAVPSESIRRLLALRDAGVLKILALGEDYSKERAETGVVITAKGRTYRFEVFIDARGQKPMTTEDLPFPSLRKMLGNAGMEIPEVDEAFCLLGSEGTAQTVFFAAIPYLMNERPFVQGITASADIGQTIGQSIGALGRVDKKDSAGPRSVIQAHLYVGDDLGSQPYIRR